MLPFKYILSGHQATTERYECSFDMCLWDDEAEGVDWGYFSTTNGDCTYCKNECDKEETCEAIECGGGYCSWWKNGKCDEAHEHDGAPEEGLKTCIKKPDFRGE